MNKYTQNEDGYIVFEDGGTSSLAYGACEKWFQTYDEAIKYALSIVTERTEEYKNRFNWNSVIVYEGAERLIHEFHSCPCGRVVFYWMNHDISRERIIYQEENKHETF